MRRVLAVFASIGLGIGTIALATPAQASSTVTLTGTSTYLDPGFTWNPNDAVTPSSASGSTFVFQNDTNVTIWLVSMFLEGDNGTSCSLEKVDCSVDASGNKTFTILGTADNGFVTLRQDDNSGGYATLPGAGFFTVSYSSGSGGDDSGSSGVAGSAPASEIQQFGLPASGNCEDGATEAMNWSGIGMDGWSISWAQWANDGAGGAVCTRTVMYDTSTAKWTVN